MIVVNFIQNECLRPDVCHLQIVLPVDIQSKSWYGTLGIRVRLVFDRFFLFLLPSSRCIPHRCRQTKLSIKTIRSPLSAGFWRL